MATATELVDETPATRIAPEDLAAKRAEAAAAEAAKPTAQDIIKDDMVIPPSQAFNSMAEKLERLMKETTAKPAAEAPKSTAPDASDKVQTDSRKPAPKTEAKTEVKTDDAATITSPKAADWKIVKEAKAKAEAEAADYKAKLEATMKEMEALKSKPQIDPVFEAKKKELEEAALERDRLRTELETVALERSDKFKNYFDRKFQSAEKQAKAAVGEEHASGIVELLAMPPSKERKERINEIREELLGIDADAFSAAVRAYDEAREEKVEQLKDAKTNYQKLMELQQQEHLTKQQEAERRAELSAAQVLSVAKKDIDSFKPSEDPSQAAFAAESEEFVKKFFQNKLAASEVALLPVLAREATRYSSVVVPSLQAKIKELEEALSKYQGASSRPAGGPPASPKGSPKSFIETFNEAWPAGNR
jgi:hypothetical protein